MAQIMSKEEKACCYRHWLVRARLAARLTQGEVAEACDISRSSYQKYEYGERTPKRSARERIENLLHVACESFDSTHLEGPYYGLRLGGRKDVGVVDVLAQGAAAAKSADAAAEQKPLGKESITLLFPQQQPLDAEQDTVM